MALGDAVPRADLGLEPHQQRRLHAEELALGEHGGGEREREPDGEGEQQALSSPLFFGFETSKISSTVTFLLKARVIARPFLCEALSAPVPVHRQLIRHAVMFATAVNESVPSYLTHFDPLRL